MTSWPVVASQVTHAQLVNQIVEWAHQGAWLAYVMHDSRAQHWASDTGFPDVFCVDATELRRGACAFEVKTGSGRERKGQAAWRNALIDAGVRSLVVYPDRAEQIRTILLDGISSKESVMRGMMSNARPIGHRKRKPPRRG